MSFAGDCIVQMAQRCGRGLRRLGLGITRDSFIYKATRRGAFFFDDGIAKYYKTSNAHLREVFSNIEWLFKCQF